MSERRRGLAAQITALIAATIAVAGVVFRVAIYEPPRSAQPPAPPHPPNAPLQAVVISVEGEVESGTGGGSWSALHPGQKLLADSVLRTGANGHTDLEVGRRSRLSIGESSEVSIRELTDTVHRFRLTRGRMVADYGGEGERVLRVEDGAGGTVAEAKAARFSVLSTGTGIAVATASGGVDLRGTQETVHVAAGEQSFAPTGAAAPLPPTPIPTSVLLKVGNALVEPNESICAEIDGEATPGSEVTVDGETVPLGPDGHFHQRVERKPGKTSALVSIRDPSGREKTRTVPCIEKPAVIRDMAIRWKTR